MTDANTARVIDAARKMAAHYTNVFNGMSPDSVRWSAGHRLTRELQSALAALDNPFTKVGLPFLPEVQAND